ncbi:MAG TPA: MBL fold metallo-hydrolase [Ktedonobacterales bacterium]|nr:MBL fold metallo-hydrolase [Ktedonobacterales bacterium]
MARVIFLGTAAALPVADRSNTALAILGDTGAPGVLVDTGGDIYPALCRASLAQDELSDLFITHAHIDHIGSLPSLIESYRLGGRHAPLRIVGLPEVIETARQIIEIFSYELTLDTWTFDVTYTAVEDGQQLTLGGMPATVMRMDHTLPSAGLRLSLSGGDFAYTSDTQPTPAIQRLAQGARVFVTECTYLNESVNYARVSRHMTALEAGQHAAVCGAETLALVHLGVAAGWTTEAACVEAAQAFTGTIIAPSDGDVLEM